MACFVQPIRCQSVSLNTNIKYDIFSIHTGSPFPLKIYTKQEVNCVLGIPCEADGIPLEHKIHNFPGQYFNTQSDNGQSQLSELRFIRQ